MLPSISHMVRNASPKSTLSALFFGLSVGLTACEGSTQMRGKMITGQYKVGTATVWLCAARKNIDIKSNLGMNLKPIVKAEGLKNHIPSTGAKLVDDMVDIGSTKCPDLIAGQELTTFDIQGTADAYSYVPTYRVYVKPDGLIHMIEAF